MLADVLSYAPELLRRKRRSATLLAGDRRAQGGHAGGQRERESFSVGTTRRATRLDFSAHQVNQRSDSGVLDAHVHVEQGIGPPERVDRTWVEANGCDVEDDRFKMVTCPSQLLE